MAVAGFAALFDIDERADAERVEKIDRLAGIVITVRVRLIGSRLDRRRSLCNLSGQPQSPRCAESMVSGIVPLVLNAR